MRIQEGKLIAGNDDALGTILRDVLHLRDGAGSDGEDWQGKDGVRLRLGAKREERGNRESRKEGERSSSPLHGVRCAFGLQCWSGCYGLKARRVSTIFAGSLSPETADSIGHDALRSRFRIRGTTFSAEAVTPCFSSSSFASLLIMSA